MTRLSLRQSWRVIFPPIHRLIRLAHKHVVAVVRIVTWGAVTAVSLRTLTLKLAAVRHVNINRNVDSSLLRRSHVHTNIRQPEFDLPHRSWSVVSAKSLPGRSRPLSCQPTQMWSCYVRPLCVRPAANHESYGQLVPTHKVWRRLQSLHEASDDAIHWLVCIYGGYSTRKMKWNMYAHMSSSYRYLFV